jgi:hypothetical protein
MFGSPLWGVGQNKSPSITNESLRGRGWQTSTIAVISLILIIKIFEKTNGIRERFPGE